MLHLQVESININKEKLMKNHLMKLCLQTFKILFLFNASVAYSATFPDVGTAQLIQKSDLIIRGQVRDIYSKPEVTVTRYSQRVNNKKILHKTTGEKLMTTFIIEVNDVYWGEFDNELIEVKMDGGCYNGKCVLISANYGYRVGESVVAFLKFDNDNNYYRYTMQAYSAFEEKNGKLLRKSDEGEQNRKFTSEKQGKKNVLVQELTIDSLKKETLRLKGEK